MTKTAFVVTPSDFRAYLLDGLVKSDDIVILERAKNFRKEYETIHPLDQTSNWFQPYSHFQLSMRSIVKVDSVNDPKFLTTIQAERPTKIILSGANYISNSLHAALLNISSIILNVHMGNPRKFRGLDSNLWQALDDINSYPSVCLHHVHQKLDHGQIESMVTSEKPFHSMTLTEFKRFEVEAAKQCLLYSSRVLNTTNESVSIDLCGVYQSAMPSNIKDKVYSLFQSS